MLHKIFGVKLVNHGTVWFIVFISFILLNCDDPASQDKDTLIRTLVERWVPAGKYYLFWDGTDTNQEFVEPGTYICRLYTQEYGQDIEITVQPGTSGKSNDDQHTLPSAEATFFLYQNEPNPFKVKDGTNIIFNIPKNASIRITIHTKK